MGLTGANLFAGIPAALPRELVETLVDARAVKIERIVSMAHSTPAGEWYDQESGEFVLVLRGRAGLRFEHQPTATLLGPGDWVTIPAHHRHRVEWTDPAQPTIWLTVHYGRLAEPTAL